MVDRYFVGVYRPAGLGSNLPMSGTPTFVTFCIPTAEQM